MDWINCIITNKVMASIVKLCTWLLTAENRTNVQIQKWEVILHKDSCEKNGPIYQSKNTEKQREFRVKNQSLTNPDTYKKLAWKKFEAKQFLKSLKPKLLNEEANFCFRRLQFPPTSKKCNCTSWGRCATTMANKEKPPHKGFSVMCIYNIIFSINYLKISNYRSKRPN